MKIFILTLALCCVTSAAQAVDTVRYALITYASAIEVPRVSLLEPSATGEVQYILTTEELTLAANTTTQDESLIDWLPMSIEAFGYDIREVWRAAAWDGFSYSLAFSR